MYALRVMPRRCASLSMNSATSASSVKLGPYALARGADQGDRHQLHAARRLDGSERAGRRQLGAVALSLDCIVPQRVSGVPLRAEPRRPWRSDRVASRPCPSVAARQLPRGRPARKSGPLLRPSLPVAVSRSDGGELPLSGEAAPGAPLCLRHLSRGAGGEGKWGLRAGLRGGSSGSWLSTLFRANHANSLRRSGNDETGRHDGFGCAEGSERERDGKSRYAEVMRRVLFITVGSVLAVLLMIILLQTGLGVDSDVTITDRNRPEIVGNDDD